MRTVYVKIESKPQEINKKVEALCGELEQVIKEYRHFSRMKDISQQDKAERKRAVDLLEEAYSCLNATSTMLLAAIINDMNGSPAQSAEAEKFFKNIKSTIAKIAIDWSATLSRDDNSRCSQRIQSNHNNHVESAKTSKCCFSCEYSSSQIQKDKPTLGVEHSHNRTPLGNNDQIVIQIPKGQNISSIQIGLDPKPSEYLGRRFSDGF